MKFSIALGLLFAGLAHCQQADPQQIKVDSFLRQNQHLKPSAELISINQDGELSIATYKEGPLNMKFRVRTQNDQMKIIGIEKVASFSGNFHAQPLALQDVSPAIEVKLQPLPLIMPQWNIQQNGDLKMKNVFDSVQDQLAEMEKKMLQDRKNIENIIEQKRLEMQQRFSRNFDIPLKQTPLLGGDHDFNSATNVQFDQPLIGGDHDYNWATIIEVQNDIDHPIVGGDGHDYNWATFEFVPYQPLIGGDDHDYEWSEVEDHPIIGGDDHDDWMKKRMEFDHPIIGGDDHDNWQKKLGKKHWKNLKEQNEIESHHKGTWQGKGSNEGKERRHHSQMSWMNKQFTNVEIAPFLNKKLPDMMQGSSILSIENKGFKKGKGFPLEIQIKDKEGNVKNVSAFFKPRKHEFLIDKITKVNKVDSNLEVGKQLVSRFIKGLEENMIPTVQLQTESKTEKPAIVETENLIAPNFIPQIEKPTLLGSSSDPDHDPEFMKLAQEIQLKVDNVVQSERQIEQVKEEPLLGESNDPDHTIEQFPLLGGPSDPDNVSEKADVSQKEFDVSGLPLPGGETDIDHQIGYELINKILKVAEDIFEEDIEDIDEAEELSEKQEKDEKLQLLIK